MEVNTIEASHVLIIQQGRHKHNRQYKQPGGNINNEKGSLRVYNLDSKYLSLTFEKGFY